MRWQDARASDNVEDQRNSGGGMPGRLMLGGGAGTIILVLVAMYFGVDPGVIMQNAPPGQQQQAMPRQVDPQEEELKEFVTHVLGDTEDVSRAVFQKMGRRYEDPKLVLFSGRVQSACGLASTAVGPFYCPADHKVYIDLTFYRQLRDRFKAPGDFAQAYVIAHEVGHHVQNLLGYSERVQSQRGRLSERDYNKLSVRLELHADFLAGVWAFHTQKARNLLEEGDYEEAIRCAQAIGDDRLQNQGQGYVVPDSFTHGTSAQRSKWFGIGFKTGDLKQGDVLYDMSRQP